MLSPTGGRAVWTNSGVLYDVRERVGHGTFGKVYMGTRVDTHQRVALKFIECSVRAPAARLAPAPPSPLVHEWLCV